METYWLTFRIHNEDVRQRTPRQRRLALEAVVEEQGIFIWKDPTSFIIFDSDSAIEDLARDIKNAVAPSVDLVLIHEMTSKNAVVLGKVKEMDDLEIQLPYVVKI